MSTLAECLITFGIGLSASVAMSFPACYDLIVRHKDRAGWVGPGAFVVGALIASAGFLILAGATP